MTSVRECHSRQQSSNAPIAARHPIATARIAETFIFATPRVLLAGRPPLIVTAALPRRGDLQDQLSVRVHFNHAADRLGLVRHQRALAKYELFAASRHLEDVARARGHDTPADGGVNSLDRAKPELVLDQAHERTDFEGLCAIRLDLNRSRFIVCFRNASLAFELGSQRLRSKEGQGLVRRRVADDN